MEDDQRDTSPTKSPVNNQLAEYRKRMAERVAAAAKEEEERKAATSTPE